MNIFAHSLPGRPQDEWQPLEDHSRNVANLAAAFAAQFGASEVARLLGQIHDIGKGSVEFQCYLKQSNGVDDEADADDVFEKRVKRRGPDHSTLGAQLLDRNVRGLGRLLSYCAAGHHAGLTDGQSDSLSSLSCRLKKELPAVGDLATFDTLNLPLLASEVKPFLSADGFSVSFFVRMLYSTLVDADFLDSEDFMSGDRSKVRRANDFSSLGELLTKLQNHYEKLDALTEESGRAKDPVVIVRNEIRKDCGCAAEQRTGLFTLKVPTGGGKTLASMWFALNHSVLHGLRRIIVVIPYTSIIEQTAKVYRDIFGSQNVLEHHSNVDDANVNEPMRLASENWEAPIVVTTNVQFFESLLANRSSKCRKLHNLAKSVIILDEAQGLPIEVLKPCLKSLEELTVRYGSSIVLSTATLPVFFNRSVLGNAALTGGTRGVMEIIAEDRNLEHRLRRTRVEQMSGKTTDEVLLARLKNERQVLVIVNTRRHARELFQKACAEMSERAVFHLSAQMCGVHRSDVLDKVRAMLSENKPCLLVSTQLIEAGVDIDFPCVFRDMAGVDSITQAAGRCNREGRLPDGGRVVIFESADYPLPGGILRAAAQQGRMALRLPESADDPLGSKTVERYFALLYSDVQKGNSSGMDKYGVLTDLLPRQSPRALQDMLCFKFKTLGESFRLIDTNSTSVIIPYGLEGRELCEQLRATFDPGERRNIIRKLQRYTVSLYGREPLDSVGQPIAERVHDAYWVLTSPELHYSEDFGVTGEPMEVFLGV